MKGGLFFLLCWIFSLAVCATPEKPGIGIETPYPLRGKPVQIFISHATWPRLEQFQVRVTYHPESILSRTQILGPPDENGYLSWTPEEAGVTVIRAAIPGAAQDALSFSRLVSVRDGRFPLWGCLIFAALVLTPLTVLTWTLLRSRFS